VNAATRTPKTRPAPTLLPRAAAAAAALAGGLALAGWILDQDALQSLVPGLVAMNPATAITFILAGASLALLEAETAGPRRRRTGQACAAAVALVGLIQLGGCVLGRDPGLDQLLFRAELGDNRMAPNTAMNFLLVGLALLLLDAETRRGRRPAQGLALLAAAGAFTGLIGYAYGVTALYGVASYIPMALNTALAFTVLAVGVLAARPDRGLMRLITSDRLGGQLARRLLPAAVGVPAILGWLGLAGEAAGLYDRSVGVALFTVASAAVLTLVVLLTTAALDRADAERRQAEAALREAAANVQDLYDHAPCGYHSLDRNGTIIAINATELRWLGCTRDEVVGRLRFTDLLTDEGRRTFQENFPRFLERGQVHDLAFDLVRKDGTTLPVTLSATAIRDEAGQYIASRSTVVDATERRRVERAIRRLNDELERRVRERTAELAEANRDLAQKNQENELFVYSVSHDLRSPLVNLQGFSKELALTCQELRTILANHDLPPAVRERGLALVDEGMAESIRYIQTAVSRLGSIIDALLRLSRAGRVEYRWQPVDVRAAVARVVEGLHATAAERGATIVVKDLPSAWGDPTAVEQVFANLIGNALAYLDPARPGVIEVGCTAAAEHVPGAVPLTTYYVKDNGLGIPASCLPKVFQAFQRFHPESVRGEGMGLAIVRRIVERHRGRIWVESAAGEGTTFFVALPAADPTAAPCPNGTPATSRSEPDGR
jgi:PAS domain S-box-containing protein